MSSNAPFSPLPQGEGDAPLNGRPLPDGVLVQFVLPSGGPPGGTGAVLHPLQLDCTRALCSHARSTMNASGNVAAAAVARAERWAARQQRSLASKLRRREKRNSSSSSSSSSSRTCDSPQTVSGGFGYSAPLKGIHTYTSAYNKPVATAVVVAAESTPLLTLPGAGSRAVAAFGVPGLPLLSSCGPRMSTGARVPPRAQSLGDLQRLGARPTAVVEELPGPPRDDDSDDSDGTCQPNSDALSQASSGSQYMGSASDSIHDDSFSVTSGGTTDRTSEWSAISGDNGEFQWPPRNKHAMRVALDDADTVDHPLFLTLFIKRRNGKKHHSHR